jgi:hypothetical protein
MTDIGVTVTAHLVSLGYAATWDHPGYVAVALPDGRFAAFGNVDEDWRIDLYDTAQQFEDGYDPSRCLSTGLPREYANAEMIALAFDVVIRAFEREKNS